MKYSIIIPIYKVEEYLPRCLDSILCQIDAQTQLILVDDGSPDGCGAICDDYAAKHEQIVVIHKPNGGVATARNEGLKVADGDYLLWVDPDDIVAENWFSEIDEVISKEHPDILHFDYYELKDEDLTPKSYGVNPEELTKLGYLRDVVRDIKVNSALWARAFRRELFEGYAFNPKLRCLEDYALLHHLILRADTIAYLPKALYYYTIRDTGLVKSLNLDVSYQSYLASLQRKEDLKEVFTEYDDMGIVSQAKGFCRNYYVCGNPEQFCKEFETCRKEVLRHAGEILRCTDLPISKRVKMLAAASKIAGAVYRKIN